MTIIKCSLQLVNARGVAYIMLHLLKEWFFKSYLAGTFTPLLNFYPAFATMKEGKFLNRKNLKKKFIYMFTRDGILCYNAFCSLFGPQTFVNYSLFAATAFFSFLLSFFFFLIFNFEAS